MDSREMILKAILKNKPLTEELPAIPAFDPGTMNLTERYRQSLEANGGKSVLINDIMEIEDYLSQLYGKEAKIGSMLPSIKGSVDLQVTNDPHLLEDLEVAVIKGKWGVSENAAIWLPEETLSHRALPFITQHLIVVLEENSILNDLHDLYKKINICESGYGVLIAGPSKTADIEQSLVIGAHGARSMVVFIIS